MIQFWLFSAAHSVNLGHLLPSITDCMLKAKEMGNQI